MPTTAELMGLIGQKITLRDKRTGASYTTKVLDVKVEWSNLRMSVIPDVWFEPTGRELASLSE